MWFSVVRFFLWKNVSWRFRIIWFSVCSMENIVILWMNKYEVLRFSLKFFKYNMIRYWRLLLDIVWSMVFTGRKGFFDWIKIFWCFPCKICKRYNNSLAKIISDQCYTFMHVGYFFLLYHISFNFSGRRQR